MSYEELICLWFGRIILGGTVIALTVLILEELCTALLHTFKLYNSILDFFWHRKEFKKWMEEKRENSNVRDDAGKEDRRV